MNGEIISLNNCSVFRARHNNQPVGQCLRSFEMCIRDRHHPTRPEKAGDRSPDNATDQTPGARRVYAGVEMCIRDRIASTLR